MFYTLENKSISIKINDIGAELCSYYDKEEGREIIWQGDPDHWKRQAPILFPIIGKVENNSYLFENKKYKLNQHGFARDNKFSIIHQSKNIITFKTSSTIKTREVFPFEFNLFIQFSLNEKELKILYRVENISKNKIYFSLGAHPGFNCPFDNTSIFSEYKLKFESEENSDRILLNDTGFRTGQRDQNWLSGDTIKLNEKLFSKDALIFDDLKSKYLTIESTKTSNRVKVGWYNYPHMGIWKPLKNAPLVCIEPWNGMADKANSNIDFKEKYGVLCVDKGNDFECFYTIENISK